MDIIQEAKEALEEIELGIFVDPKYQKTLMDLISRLVDRLEWKPIESAPKDGTNILVFYEKAAVEFVHIAWWDNDEHDQWEVQKFDNKEQKIGWWSYTENSVGQSKLENYDFPTHWLPLPPVGDK